MYYLLNYAPSILYIVALMMSISIDFTVFAITYLFVMPIYLLLINAVYLIKKELTFLNSIFFMLSVVFINTAVCIIVHKIQTGYFIGDVPEGIYYAAVGIPMLIILIGVYIIHLRK